MKSKEFDLFIKMLLKMLKKGDVKEVIELLEESVDGKDRDSKSGKNSNQ